MEAQTEIEAAPLAPLASDDVDDSRWSTPKRVAFRFFFVYLGLYFFPFPLSVIPYENPLTTKYEDLWNIIIVWTGKHILHLSYDITIRPNGSGDTTWNYVQILCMAALAIAATIMWSVLDSRRPAYPKLYQWLRLFVRLNLAAALFTYGFAKAIPLQMPSPMLSTLLEPYGESSPMGLLWTFIGASRPYEIFTGLAEVAGGLLLILPRTAALGALIGIADMLQVFMLNMCYDVPVKLYSFHLLLLGLFMIAPDLGRLGNLFFRGRQAELSKMPPLFKKPAFNTAAVVVQILFALYLIGAGLAGGYSGAKQYGFLAPKPPLYGIWSVDEFTVDGQIRPPLIDDDTRWRRVIFDRFPGALGVQLTSGTRQRFRIQVDTDKKTIQFTKREDPNAKSDFTYEEPGKDQMTLAGNLDGHQIQARLHKTDEGNFLLMSRGFHWINEVPYNR